VREERRLPHVAGFTACEPLGEGGFAVAWAGRRDSDARPVVIKVGRVGSPLLAARFAREAEAMVRVGSPHVPRLYAEGRLEGGEPYLVMERLFGETLGVWMAKQVEPPRPSAALGVADGLLDALGAAHARGMVHRDLKPENIFLVGGGERVVLLDFGLVKRMEGEDAGLTRTGVAEGTPEYMAPEQLRAERDVGAGADIYAVGVILYELLTLRLPFVGEASAIEHGHLSLRPPRPSTLVAMPTALEALLLACLAKQPERRPASVDALRRALREASQAPELRAVGAAREAEKAGGARLIADGKQPVVLLVIESEGDAGAVAFAITRRGGFVARQRGKRFVAVFSGDETDSPAAAALAAAEALVATGARAALHLERVLVRRSARGAKVVYGAAVDRPETWLSSEPWSGVWRTAEFERALPEAGSQRALGVEPEDASTGSLSRERSTDARLRIPLFGREAEMAAIAASMRASFEGRRAGLLTVIGDSGLGKSRLAVEAAELARSLAPEGLWVSLFAQASAGGNAEALADELCRALGAPFDDAAGDEVSRQHHLAAALARRAGVGPVAVIVDDAQWAEGALLDALEYATLDGAAVALWVMVVAHPRFSSARPSWGSRTRHHERLSLRPLDEGAAMALGAKLLEPAAYPPAAVLARLAQWSGGNPFSLSEIVRALKRMGVVRRRPGTSSDYIATADFDALPPSPAWQWLATRRIEALPPELGACLRLCSVLGSRFCRDEVEAVQDALERKGLAGTPVDIDIGLRALSDEGLLERGAEGRYAFQSALFQDAIYELLDPGQRGAVHRAALAYWQGRAAGQRLDDEALSSWGRHAAACEQREQAADAYFELGERAFARHRHVDADRHYTAALELLAEDDAQRRALSLTGRGRCRYRFGRAREAQEDLVAARALARALGDDVLVAEALLEEATALDWLREFGASAERMEEARPIVKALGDARLAVKLLVAEGRTLWRRRQNEASIAMLARASAEAGALGEYESRVIALLMLSYQLATVDRLDEAGLRFQEVIALTMEARDRPHLAMAYLNRSHLWMRRGDTDRLVGDQRRAVELAREIGDPSLEWLVSGNLGEMLYQSGIYDDALTIALRMRMLEERFRDRQEARGKILLARTLCAMDRHEEARSVIEQIRDSDARDLIETSEWSEEYELLVRMLRLMALEIDEPPSATPAAWEELMAAAKYIEDNDVRLEIFYWCARMALRGRRRQEALQTVERSRSWRAGNPTWGPSLDDLERRIAAAS